LDKEFRSYVLSIKGKTLGCFCKKHRSDSDLFALDDTPCHAEFYANWLNSWDEFTD